jgi:hippurate hydrolase
MHACGHDGHTAILLGAARVLAAMRDRPRPVTFLFQPAEEDGGGAATLIRDGALGGDGAGPAGIGTPVERIYGLHGWPLLPLGVVATRPGPLLAATDDFDLTVRGVQGHAAYPHLAADPIVAGAAIVQALQTLASRRVGPVDSVICTVGQFLAGTANNIIPETARLVGTVRTLRADTRAKVAADFRRIVEQVAAAHGCAAELDWQPGYPMTLNDAAEADRVLRTAAEAFGEARAMLVPEPGMGGEDFSYYGQHARACFFLLGLCPPGADPARVPQLHQAEFDFADEAIPTGVEMMVRLALH